MSHHDDEGITVRVNYSVLGPHGTKLRPGQIVTLEDSEYIGILLGSDAVDLIDPPYYDAIEKYRRPGVPDPGRAGFVFNKPVEPVEPVEPIAAADETPPEEADEASTKRTYKKGPLGI